MHLSLYLRLRVLHFVIFWAMSQICFWPSQLAGIVKCRKSLKYGASPNFKMQMVLFCGHYSSSSGVCGGSSSCWRGYFVGHDKVTRQFYSRFVAIGLHMRFNICTFNPLYVLQTMQNPSPFWPPTGCSHVLNSLPFIDFCWNLHFPISLRLYEIYFLCSKFYSSRY